MWRTIDPLREEPNLEKFKEELDTAVKEIGKSGIYLFYGTTTFEEDNAKYIFSEIFALVMIPGLIFTILIVG